MIIYGEKMELTILGKTDCQEISYFTLHMVFLVFSSHWAAISCGAVKLGCFASNISKLQL